MAGKVRKIDWQVMGWLYAVPGHRRFLVLVLAAIQALLSATDVLYALLLREIVDHAVNKDMDGFIRSAGLAAALIAGQIAVRAFSRFITEYSRSSIENAFKRRLMENVLKRDFARVSAVHSGEWMNRLTNDTLVVTDSYVTILPGLIGMLVKLVCAVWLLLVIDSRFAAIILPGGLLMLLFTYAFRRILKKLHRDIQKADGKLRIFMQEHISSLIMVRAYGAEEKTLEAAQTYMDAHKTARMRRNHFSNLCNMGFGAVINGMYLFGMVYCGYGILHGRITFGTLTAVTDLIAQIRSPVANLTGYLPRYYTMMASAERLQEIEAFADDYADGAYSAQQVRSYYADGFRRIQLDDVSYTYLPTSDDVQEAQKQTMPVVLRQINMTLAKGEVVAFTGQSGCGKSTLMKLIMGLYRPDGGRCVLVSGQKGQEEQEEPLSEKWRRLFAYVPQGNALMSGTIREIITFSAQQTQADDERIDTALRIACADTFVYALEQGVDTLLGERGTGLSEGQMQRIAIARAVYADCPVLMLDEATSALDSRTERQVIENLQRMTDKTVLIVTHRPAALEICNRILRITPEGIVDETAEYAGKAR